MITVLEKFCTELERGWGGGRVKAITRTASAVKNLKIRVTSSKSFQVRRRSTLLTSQKSGLAMAPTLSTFWQSLVQKIGKITD
jgi:hypothetical protein